jgi:hypothetical protein
MAELLLPGSLAIITDAFGILVIYVSSIALMKKVAIVGAFWAMSIAVTEMLLNRLMIAYLPAPKDTKHYVPAPMVWVLHHLSWMATSPRSVRVILIVWIFIVLGSLSVAPFVAVGESHPGTPILWPDSEFSKSAAVISKRFYGADELTLVVETEMEAASIAPRSCARSSDAALHGAGPEGGRHAVVVDYLKAITRTFHNADPLVDGAVHAAGDRRPALPYEAGSPIRAS